MTLKPMRSGADAKGAALDGSIPGCKAPERVSRVRTLSCWFLAGAVALAPACECGKRASQTCASNSVSGIVNRGESLVYRDLRVNLDGMEAHGDKVFAIVSILDSGGNIIKKDKIGESETKTFLMIVKKKEATFDVSMGKFAQGHASSPQWAELSVSPEGCGTQKK
jgi:hypothetical protein